MIKERNLATVDDRQDVAVDVGFWLRSDFVGDMELAKLLSWPLTSVPITSHAGDLVSLEQRRKFRHHSFGRKWRLALADSVNNDHAILFPMRYSERHRVGTSAAGVDECRIGNIDDGCALMHADINRSLNNIARDKSFKVGPKQ